MSIRVNTCVLVLLSVSCMTTCVEKPRAAPPTMTEGDKPLCFLHRISGRPVPSRAVISGIVVAVWEDGRVVRVAQGSGVAQKYVRGRMKDGTLAELRRLLADNKLLRKQEGCVPPTDAKVERLVVRVQDGVYVWAHSPPMHEIPAVSQVAKFLLDAALTEECAVDGEPYSRYPHDWYAGWPE